MALTRVAASGISTGGTFVLENVNTSGIVTAGTVQVGAATTIHSAGIDLGSGNITSHNINSTGIITSTSFVGPVTGNVTGDLTGNVTGNVSSSGANTLGSLSVTNNATVGGALTVTGDLTVNGTTTTIDTAVTAVDSLAIDGDATAGGSVGIGLTNPTSKLHISVPNGTGQNGGIILQETGNQEHRIYVDNAHQYNIINSSSGTWTWDSNGVIAKLTTTGLGIGTDAPTKKLEVVGDIRLPSNYTISWGDDTTRIFRATDDIRIDTGNSERLRITSGGNIGIGLTNPDLKLHLNGTNALPSTTGNSPTGHLTLRNKAGGASHGMFMGVSNAAPYSSWIQAQDANNNATNYPLLLNPNGGNIGIGTDNPSAKLNVYGGDNTFIRLHNTSNGRQGIQWWNTYSGQTKKKCDITWNEGNANWEFRHYRSDSQATRPYANIDFYGGVVSPTSATDFTGNLLMRIHQDGNIGIGTINPQEKLHVQGDVRLVDNSPRIGFHDANAANNLSCTGGIEIFDSSGTRGAYMGATEGSGALTFGVSPSAGAAPKERLRINSSGYVGVGTDFTPQKTLHLRDSNASGVQGNTQLRIEKGVGGGAAPGSISRNNCYIHLGGSEWKTGGGGHYLIGFGYSNGEVGTGFPAYVGYVETSSAGYTNGDLIFGTRGNTDGTNSPTERMRIHDNGYVEGHRHPIESGSTIRTQGGTGSGAATGWVSVASTTWDIDVNETQYMSCSFEGYIQSGTYWWTWRLYNSTRSEYLIPFLGANRLDNTSGYGSIAYIGSVHSYSRQPWVAFKKSASTQTGDTIQLQLHASSGGGNILYTNAAQILYARYVVFHMGVTTGGSDYF